MCENLTISEAFAMYITDYIAFKGQSAKTQEGYTETRKQLIKRFGDVDICSLTFNDIRDWKLWLDKGREPNTVRNYIICTRVVLRFLTERNYPVISPESIPVPIRVNKEASYLTDKEMQILFIVIQRKVRGYSEFNRTKDYAIVKTLYSTGLRNSELCSLNRTSIKNNTFTVIGKGNKPRIGFVSEEVMQCIDEHLKLRSDKSPALFVNCNGKRITPGNVRRIFEHIRKHHPEFALVHPHTIRHTYATRLLINRVDIRYVKEFMGHSSLDTTAHYTHIINEDLKDIYMKAIDNNAQVC